jgi:ribosomal protein S18 acetylase RimI-like enzyme
VRSPLFCDVTTGARIEAAETDLVAAVAGRRSGFVRPLAGGVAAFAEPHSPFNKIAGLGFAGIPTAAELADVERAYAAVGAQVQAELSILADPGIGELLTGRGYRLVSFENVLGRTLVDVASSTAPAGIEVRPSGDDELDTWLNVVADGVARPDPRGLPSHEEFPRDTLVRAMHDLTTAPGLRRYLALRDGVPAGGASVRFADGLAQLTGAATAPQHRRRGIQAALLAARLADAAAAGCDLAVVTTQPGSMSQKNVQRQGFDLLYTRAVLVR